jgi:YHS domain-containing protein
MNRRLANLSHAGSLATALSISAIPAAFSLITVLAPGPALAFDADSTSAINVDKAGVMLRGYDPVSYFAGGKPTKGSAQYSAKHDGATYHFTSAKNRDAFKAAPDRYSPQFGGFCAMGAALGKKLDGDPAVFRVADGKLYLNVNADVQKRWLDDVPGNVKQANATWPSIRNKAPKDVN